MCRCVAIQGEVRGYLGADYTRDLETAVILAVHATDRDGQPAVFEITAEGIAALRWHRPDIHAVVVPLIGGLDTRASDAGGRFRFACVPTGDWGYVVAAYDGEGRLLGRHTDPMGRDGQGGREILHGGDLARDGGRSGIIVPVFDNWYRDHFPRAYQADPPTDPTRFIPGLRRC